MKMGCSRFKPSGFGETGVKLGGTARSPEDVVALHRLGLRFAELPIADPAGLSPFKGTYMNLKRELGLFYLCHGPREGDPNDRRSLGESYLPKVLRILSMMPEWGMKLLTFHLWMDPRFVGRDALDFKLDLLQKISERAERVGVIFCIENLSERPEDLDEAFQRVPRLNLTLDLGHCELLSDRNTGVSFLERHPDRIKHIHLHDNLGGDSPRDDLHLPVGEGMIDFRPIFKKLGELRCSRTITLELKPPQIEKCLGRVKEQLQAVH